MPTWAKWAVSMLVAVGLVSIGWRVSAVLVTLHVLVCFILIIVIMLQSGNAADLAGAFGGAGSQTAFGPRGAATFLSRATTWCAIVFMMTSLTLSFKRAPARDQYRLDSGTDFAAGQSSGETEPAAHSDSDSGPASSAGAGTRTRAEPGSQERSGFCYNFVVYLVMRSWRNWQTHQLEGLALARAWWFESTRPHQLSSDNLGHGALDSPGATEIVLLALV